MRLDRLPRGVTGVFDQLEHGSSVDMKHFKAAVFHVAQHEGGAVQGIDSQTVARSYYAADLVSREGSYTVLCNIVFPLLAFVPQGGYGFTRLQYIESVSLASTFSTLTDFRALDADWLRGPVPDELISDLAPVEREQLRYWRSLGMADQVGSIIFNAWD